MMTSRCRGSTRGPAEARGRLRPAGRWPGRSAVGPGDGPVLKVGERPRAHRRGCCRPGRRLVPSAGVICSVGGAPASAISGEEHLGLCVEGHGQVQFSSGWPILRRVATQIIPATIGELSTSRLRTTRPSESAAWRAVMASAVTRRDGNREPGRQGPPAHSGVPCAVKGL